MLRRVARFHAPFTLTALATLTWLFGGCNGPDVVIGETTDAAPPTFVSPDAEPVVPKEGLTEYCPSSECPTGHTTCPTSRFPCEVDLRTDRDNCGACGVACPRATFRETYECVEGRCVLQCATGAMMTLDCDGIAENGCEVDAIDNDNCGACGNECLDPAKPCVARNFFSDIGCGCLGDDLYCTEPYVRCLDGKKNDQNCGACGNECDRTGGGAEVVPNAYYGCRDGECGNLKCENGFGNCDGAMANGCETVLLTRENCGLCGNVCDSGQECRLNKWGVPQCMCPAGKSFCSMGCIGDLCFGECYDLASDPDNCGRCGFSCRTENEAHSSGVCTYGTCGRLCVKGRADCNGNVADDCEIDTDSDPRNCGGCGNVCDAVAGQACVGGRCVVEPCDQASDGGVVAR